MHRQIAYCTNVHAGANLAETRANLLSYAVEVKRKFSAGQPMGVGLWLSAQTARDLLEQKNTQEFAAWLSDVGLVPFTFNGFPYCDFHQAVVKHKVYQPTWFDRDRLAYTFDLVKLLDALAPAEWEGSISTLPLAWREPAPTAQQWQRAAAQLRELADFLRQLEQTSGRLIYLCLEPEPGCIIQRSRDVVSFFENHLLPGSDEEAVRRYIRVCHDVCHAVVMCEDQAEVLEVYAAAGILVGKVQVSSAVCVPFDEIEPSQRQAAREQLASFSEDRYLHQTTIQRGPRGEPAFFDDLPDALARARDVDQLDGTWRVHFHIPVYLERFGLLTTSQAEIETCLKHCQQLAYLQHFEVETYAWGVLPKELRQDDLATGIAHEMAWFRELAKSHWT